MTPPPTAVIRPRVTTPTTSTCAARTAVNPPFNAKANVPTRSNPNSTGNSVGTTTVSPHRLSAGAAQPLDSSVAKGHRKPRQPASPRPGGQRVSRRRRRHPVLLGGGAGSSPSRRRCCWSAVRGSCSGGSRAAAPPPPLPNVRWRPPGKRSRTPSVRRADLSFVTSGTVTKVRVKVGDRVTTNQRLASVGSDALKADLEGARRPRHVLRCRGIPMKTHTHESRGIH